MPTKLNVCTSKPLQLMFISIVPFKMFNTKLAITCNYCIHVKIIHKMISKE